MLKQSDYHVISGADASTTINQINYNGGPGMDFDAVISCVEKSGIDDGKVISLIQKKYKPIPVMAIIPYGSELDDVETTKRKGCTSILHSPFEPDESLGCLEQVFEQSI